MTQNSTPLEQENESLLKVTNQQDSEPAGQELSPEEIQQLAQEKKGEAEQRQQIIEQQIQQEKSRFNQSGNEDHSTDDEDAADQDAESNFTKKDPTIPQLSHKKINQPKQD